MSSLSAGKLRDSIAGARWADAVSLLQTLNQASAAQEIAKLPFEQQQELLRHVPPDLAASLLPHFRYYDQYVLLHALPPGEMREVIDRMHPNERMRFFDELPEEAWQRSWTNSPVPRIQKLQ